MADDINFADDRPEMLEGKTFAVDYQENVNQDPEKKGDNKVEQNTSYSYSSFFKPRPAETFGSVLTTTALNNLEAQPSFIPQFPDLRRRCLENTENKLRAIERHLFECRDPEQESRMLNEATALLRLLDDQTDGELKRHQLEDPGYAEERGLEVLHFVIDKKTTSQHRGHQELWMMISQPWGPKAKSLIESDENKVPWKFVGELNQLGQFYFKRKKTTVESQPKAVQLDKNTGMYVAVPRNIFLWRVLFLIAFTALLLFFGVGIIATNSEFSPLFQRIFFWIAIIWTMAPSLIMSWVVKASGGDLRDTTAAFMGSIAIWLVIIQIGQTHLLTQNTSVGSGGGNSTGGSF